MLQFICAFRYKIKINESCNIVRKIAVFVMFPMIYTDLTILRYYFNSMHKFYRGKNDTMPKNTRGGGTSLLQVI